MWAYCSRDPEIVERVARAGQRALLVHAARAELVGYFGRDLAVQQDDGPAGREEVRGFIPLPHEHEDCTYAGRHPRTLYYSTKHGLILPIHQRKTATALKHEFARLWLQAPRVTGLPAQYFDGTRVRVPELWVAASRAWVRLDGVNSGSRVDASLWTRVPDEQYWGVWSAAATAATPQGAPCPSQLKSSPTASTRTPPSPAA